MRNKPKILFTDGEGPLVVKDLARDIAINKVSPIYFDALSMWVAFKSERSDGTLKPGDTLSLLVPHLLNHHISDEDLEVESRGARLARGVQDWISILLQDGWEFRVVSTAYQHLWDVVGDRLGIPRRTIASTRINLELIRRFCWSKELSNLTTEAEKFVIQMSSEVEAAIRAFRSGRSLDEVFASESMRGISARFEDFYFRQLPNIKFEPLAEVPVVNGFRKVEAVFKFAEELNFGGYDEIVYIGDSITDDIALTFVRENGGLAIALNGDEFAIRNANLAVACEDRRELVPILYTWFQGGMNEVRSLIEGKSVASTGKERIFAIERETVRHHLVEPGKIGEIARIHKEFREQDRSGAVPIL